MGCSTDTTYNSLSPDQSSSSVLQQEQVFITDRTGKLWDVTHAQKYGLDPSGYEYGLGPYAIRPLNNPLMLTPGDAGYPSPAPQGFLGHIRGSIWT